MAKRTDKKADRVRQIFDKVNSKTRKQWEYVNQKGFDFSNDNQLTDEEHSSLEEQGMPTFTINRIIPIVEMLNFYSTANQPRWQAVGATGDDVDVAAVFSDIADYIWYNSDGQTLYSNAINDAITKSIGWISVNVDKFADNGMGEVKIEQPDPFDIYVDPKSRDILFRDAAFIMIRKVLPKSHLEQLFPEHASKIKKAGTDNNNDYSYTEKSVDNMQHDFHYKDVTESEAVNTKGEHDKLIEFFELYEKIQVEYVNVFHRVPADPQALEMAKQEQAVALEEMQKELAVQFKEQVQQLQQAAQSGEMIPDRLKLEIEKLQKGMQDQIAQAQMQMESQLQAMQEVVENVIITKKEFDIMNESEDFAKNLVNAVPFFDTRIKQTCVVGDKTLYEYVYPTGLKEYPLVPIHYKWTGTPFPMSAVSPLIGKQREINKAHQIMVHNASLGSSLRWMYEEGSIDTDYWEKYSSSPGALLPRNPGSEPPTPVQPAPLSNAFFSITQEGKQDIEHLAGIYGAAQGAPADQHETYKGMLAIDEYGTRRVKSWMKNAVEPALKQIGEIVKDFSQVVYTANKVFRIIQPQDVNGEKEVEINIPVYNDLGEAINMMYDYSAAKFDVRIVAGSTLPVNRWAYLAELKELMQLGVIDDVALLAEADIRNKKAILKRKSLYSQLQGQLQGMEQTLKDKEGTIETLERQLVQAGIKAKVDQANIEVQKRKEEQKGQVTKEVLQTQAEQKLLRNVINNEAQSANSRMKDREAAAAEGVAMKQKELEQQLELEAQEILNSVNNRLDNNK
ncbi:MAG: putative portal protein [Prokaryotic dsDNA virus sp.]|nr:MAG: putative portal protein [Prokaryotic dsDNA virus sp.]|tara:strand:+ start:59 stop:2428 length:2370 start_codon:yes stop_codon:yes gene_type:complete